LEAQVKACRELKADGIIKDKDIGNIFHDNIKRLAHL
jgi:hypothetical protein